MNGDKPIDLLELARQAGVAEAREQSLRSRQDSVHLITFESNRDPGHHLPVGRHPQTSRVVFPDMKRHGSRIKAGETYFCDLVEYRPAVGPQVYYANPITKVDASYLFDLRPDLVDKLVEVLMRTAQAQVLEQARAQIQVKLEQSSKVQLDIIASERDSLRTENLTLRTELARAASPNQGARRPAGPRKLSDAGDSRLSTTREAPRTGNPIDDALPQDQRLGLSSSTGTTQIRRPTADELQSPLLGQGHYFVHVSPDREKLYIHAHPEGNLIAVDSRLRIPGLAVLRPFDGEEDLVASANPRVGGLAVDLTRRM